MLRPGAPIAFAAAFARASRQFAARFRRRQAPLCHSPPRPPKIAFDDAHYLPALRHDARSCRRPSSALNDAAAGAAMISQLRNLYFAAEPALRGCPAAMRKPDTPQIFFACAPASSHAIFLICRRFSAGRRFLRHASRRRRITPARRCQRCRACRRHIRFMMPLSTLPRQSDSEFLRSLPILRRYFRHAAEY